MTKRFTKKFRITALYAAVSLERSDGIHGTAGCAGNAERIDGQKKGPAAALGSGIRHRVEAGRAFTLPKKSASNEKENTAIRRRLRALDLKHRPRAAHNDPMVDIANLHERATGAHVSKTLPCGDVHIVLLDYDQASRFKLWENLRRVKSTGGVVWAPSTPSSNDIFTDVDWRDGRLVAWTWECFKITVDQETCRPVEVLFTT